MTRKSRAAKFDELVVNAIKLLQAAEGSTANEIAKYMSSEYEVPATEVRKHVKLTLKRGIESGFIQKSKRGYTTWTNLDGSSSDAGGDDIEGMGGESCAVSADSDLVIGDSSNCEECLKSKVNKCTFWSSKEKSTKGAGRKKNKPVGRQKSAKSAKNKQEAGGEESSKKSSRRLPRSSFMEWYNQVVGNKKQLSKGQKNRRNSNKAGSSRKPRTRKQSTRGRSMAMGASKRRKPRKAAIKRAPIQIPRSILTRSHGRRGRKSRK